MCAMTDTNYESQRQREREQFRYVNLRKDAGQPFMWHDYVAPASVPQRVEAHEKNTATTKTSVGRWNVSPGDRRWMTIWRCGPCTVSLFTVGPACAIGAGNSGPSRCRCGVGAGTCSVVNVILRPIDYVHYRQANEEGAALYEEKLRLSYDTYNAQNQIIGLPPVRQTMQRGT